LEGLRKTTEIADGLTCPDQKLRKCSVFLVVGLDSVFQNFTDM